MRYQRMSYPDGDLIETTDHVRAHLSACCSPTDSPDEFAIEVDIRQELTPEGTMVIGEINREPVADYLEPGYEPYDDALFHVGLPAKDHPAVDFTPEQLEIHLAEKAAR